MGALFSALAVAVLVEVADAVAAEVEVAAVSDGSVIPVGSVPADAIEDSDGVGTGEVPEGEVSEGWVTEGEVSEGVVSEGVVSEGDVSEGDVSGWHIVSKMAAGFSEVTFQVPS